MDPKDEMKKDGDEVVNIQILNEADNPGGQSIWFFCPGCEIAHRYAIGTGPGPRWNWNGNKEKPTLTPSLLCNTGDKRCHLFLTDGKLHFCKDCSHSLAGKICDLPELPNWLTGEANEGRI